MKKWLILCTIAFLALNACNDDGTVKNRQPAMNPEASLSPATENIEAVDPKELPADIKEEPNPAFPIGDHAMIQTEQKKEMHGAEAVILGAYDTTAYAVSYKPTNDTGDVWNYKWVIQEELENSEDTSLEPGNQVIIQTNRIEGIKGAKATIESSSHTTVYLVNYEPTTKEDTVLHYKWVIEDELSALK